MQILMWNWVSNPRAPHVATIICRARSPSCCLRKAESLRKIERTTRDTKTTTKLLLACLLKSNAINTTSRQRASTWNYAAVKYVSKQASKSFVVVFVSRVVRSILRSDSAQIFHTCMCVPRPTQPPILSDTRIDVPSVGHRFEIRCLRLGGAEACLLRWNDGLILSDTAGNIDARIMHLCPISSCKSAAVSDTVKRCLSWSV